MNRIDIFNILRTIVIDKYPKNLQKKNSSKIYFNEFSKLSRKRYPKIERIYNGKGGKKKS